MNKLTLTFLLFFSICLTFSDFSLAETEQLRPQDAELLRKKCLKHHHFFTDHLILSHIRNPSFEKACEELKTMTAPQKAKLIKKFDEMANVLQFALCASQDPSSHSKEPTFNEYL